MRMYTVSELAKKLNVNEETIRRWRIHGRNGVHLECIIGIGKQGHRITSDALKKFFEMNPGLCTDELEKELNMESYHYENDTSPYYSMNEDTVDETTQIIINIINERKAKRMELLKEVEKIDLEIKTLEKQIESK